MEFGVKLRKLRKARGLRQDEVAGEIGVSRRSYISYEKENVRPRKRSTYEKLAEVLGCDTAYLLAEDSPSPPAGFLAGASLVTLGAAIINPVAGALVGAALAAESGIRSQEQRKSKETLSYNNDMLLEFEKRQRQFRASALGIIVKALADKEINCRMGDRVGLKGERAYPDEYLIITEQEISSWWFIFWARDPGVDEQAVVSLPDRADIMFSRFSTAKADPGRKASIVVDDESLFDELCEIGGRNSYRGNMTAILIDTENARVEKEELLSSFDIDDANDKLSII